MVTDAGPWRTGSLAAGVLIIAACVAQLLSIDYGTRVNDVPYVAHYAGTQDVQAGSALQRNIVVNNSTAPDRERPDLWATRFKLYSVEADEIVNIMALARINQHRTRPDPGFYQYGGAYIYPLGAWYFALTKLGLVEVRDLSGLLAEPQRMDRVWITGRLFTLLAFLGSAALLFLSFRRLTTVPVALTLLALYLLCPGSVLFSQIMKPHWYALLWVNLALYCVVQACTGVRLTLRRELLLALAIGMAVGSAVTFALFAVMLWVVLAILVRQKAVERATLARVPAAALLVFACTNPYYFLNYKGMVAEKTELQNWFNPTLSLDVITSFVGNSLFTSLGIALTLLFGFLLLRRVIKPSSGNERLFALALIGAVLFAAFMTSSIGTWHSNIRYISYALPAGLIFLAAFSWRYRAATLGVTLAATLLQSVPLRVAYFDEDHPDRSTRLAAASWIDQNIPPGEGICVHTRGPAPYDVPPFQLKRYAINQPGCPWNVRVERETDSLVPVEGTVLVHRFRPRFSPAAFPLVFGHINPQISVYRAAEPAQAAR